MVAGKQKRAAVRAVHACLGACLLDLFLWIRAAAELPQQHASPGWTAFNASVAPLCTLARLPSNAHPQPCPPCRLVCILQFPDLMFVGKLTSPKPLPVFPCRVSETGDVEVDV